MNQEPERFTVDDHKIITGVTIAVSKGLELAQTERLIAFPGGPYKADEIESKLFVIVRFVLEEIERQAGAR